MWSSTLLDNRHRLIAFEALGLVDIRVLDHFIIGDGRCFSFSEHGLL
jgi:DNA repair protein RadC